MPTVMLREFDKSKREFVNVRDIEVLQVPTKGDKITIDIADIGYIFEVYDVHYNDDNSADVNAIRLSDIDTYYGSKYPDIIK